MKSKNSLQTLLTEWLDRAIKNSLQKVPDSIEYTIDQVIKESIGLESIFSSITTPVIKKALDTVVKDIALDRVKKYKINLSKSQTKVIDDTIDRIFHEYINRAIEDALLKLVDQYLDKHFNNKIEKLIAKKAKSVEDILRKAFDNVSNISSDISNPEFGKKSIEEFIIEHSTEKNLQDRIDNIKKG